MPKYIDDFIDYLTNYRMEKAKQLLISADSLIYEISEAVGYSNSNYFSKLFKKYTGVSPEEYKKGNYIAKK